MLKRQPAEFPLISSARSPLPASKACFHARSPPDDLLFSLPDCYKTITDLEMLSMCRKYLTRYSFMILILSYICIM